MNKEIFYTAIIPGISVSSGKMEYYFFARDEHDNQSTWPSGGEETPNTITIIDHVVIGDNMPRFRNKESCAGR